MPFVIAAIFVVGGLCLLDLLLTFGVIRRLREHTNMLNGLDAAELRVGLAVGETAAAFTATTVSGDQVTGPTDVRVVACFSSWCSVCPERVPPFIDYLTRHRIDPETVLTIVAADVGSPPTYLYQLAEVSRACLEPAEGPVIKAFQVSGFPAFFLLDEDGTVTAAGYDPSALPEPAAV